MPILTFIPPLDVDLKQLIEEKDLQSIQEIEAIEYHVSTLNGDLNYFQIACLYGCYEIVVFFSKINRYIHLSIDKYENNACFYAALSDSEEGIQILLYFAETYGDDYIKHRNHLNLNLLHISCLRKLPKTLEFILKHQIHNFDFQDNQNTFNKTAISFIIRNKSFEMLEKINEILFKNNNNIKTIIGIIEELSQAINDFKAKIPRSQIPILNNHEIENINQLESKLEQILTGPQHPNQNIILQENTFQIILINEAKEEYKKDIEGINLFKPKSMSYLSIPLSMQNMLPPLENPESPVKKRQPTKIPKSPVKIHQPIIQRYFSNSKKK